MLFAVRSGSADEVLDHGAGDGLPAMLVLAGFIWRSSTRKQIKSQALCYAIGSTDRAMPHGNWTHRRPDGAMGAGWWRRGWAGGLTCGRGSRFYLKSVIY